MLLTRLKVDYFGKFSGKEIELKPGINLIYGENEAGKSTLHTFIKGMLFGIERLRGRGASTKEDTYTRYLPWEYPGAYGGQMDIEVKGRKYRLQRSFHANDKAFTILDIKTGREVKLKEGHISELIPGLTEDIFRNTISIEQLRAATNAELSSHVRNYITNLSIAKSKEVNVEKAISSLKGQKKALDSIPYASKINDLSDEIKKGMAGEERIDTLTESFKDLEDKERGLKEEMDGLKISTNIEEGLMEELPAILEKHSTYQELNRQYSQLEYQRKELKDRISAWESEADKRRDINDVINEALMLDAKLTEYQNRILELNMEQKKNIKEVAIKYSIFVGVLFAVAVISFNISKSYVTTVAALIVTLIIGAVLLIFFNKRGRATGKYENKEQNKSAQDNRAQIRDINQRYIGAKGRIRAILDVYQLKSIHDISGLQQEYIKANISLEHGKKQLDELSYRAKDLEDRCDELHDNIMIYMRNFILEEELTFEAITRLQEVISTKKKEIEKRQAQLSSLQEECRFQIGKIRWELSQMEENETELIKNKDLYSDIKQKQMENALEADAINLALSTIQELSTTIHDSFGMELNNAVSEVISEVTNNKYQDIKIDEKLNVKLGWNDNYILLDRLSAGTIDQVYFALRLAVADLLLGQDNMPLMLDDSFALYDGSRVKAALNKIANRSQVLLFSCQMREKIFLEELGIPYNYICL